MEHFGGQSYWWGGNLIGTATFPVTLNVANKLVYSIHDYPASLFAQPWFSAGNYPQNLGGVWDGYWGYIVKNHIAPVLVGEFGSKLDTVSDQQWMDKLTDYMDGDFDLNGTNDLAAGKKGISWTMWCFNPNSGDTGGIVGDDWTTVNQTKLGYIQASMAPLLGAGGSGQTVTFTVALSAASAQAVTVAWATMNGTALAGTDFTAASGTLTFAAGQTSKTITITLLPSVSPIETKAFTVQLSNPTASTLATSTATAALTPNTAWHGWLRGRFYASELADVNITGSFADPDQDGVSNLLEYATAMNPIVNDALPTFATMTLGALEFLYTKNKAATDVTCIVEWSDTLAANSWSSAGVTEQLITDNGTVQTVKATCPAGTNGRRFMRLRVTQP